MILYGRLCRTASLSTGSAFAYVWSFPTLRCHHKSHDLQSQPRRIVTFAFVIRPVQWIWLTAHFPLVQSSDFIQKAELSADAASWQQTWKRLERSGDTRSLLAQYIDIMQYCFHVGHYIIQKKLLFKVIFHPKSFEYWTISVCRRDRWLQEVCSAWRSIKTSIETSQIAL